MADRQIIFSASMVRALLDGRKSQTRRIIKLNGRLPEYCGPSGCMDDPTCWGWDDPEHGDWVTLETEPGQRMGWRDWIGAPAPGDRLWVREHWRVSKKQDAIAPRDLDPRSMTVFFEAGGSIANQDDRDDWRPDDWPKQGEQPEWVGRFRPGMFMPRWASRLTLVVTDVRVQRLQEISDEDAVAEGVDHDQDRSRGPVIGWRDYLDRGGKCASARGSFQSLWNSLHGPEAWASNPWCVAISFSVQKGNIDAL